jgi:ankyrin repeat protein
MLNSQPFFAPICQVDPRRGYQSPLMLASLAGFPEVVKTLLELGANPAIGELREYTPMHGAAFQGASRELSCARGGTSTVDRFPRLPACVLSWARACTDAGTRARARARAAACRHAFNLVVDVDDDDDVGCDAGRPEVISVLIDHGLDPSDRHKDGFTPIHRACWGKEARHTEAVRMLVEKGGVDPEQPDSSGKTPIQLASMSKNAGTMDYLAQVLLARMPQAERDAAAAAAAAGAGGGGAAAGAAAGGGGNDGHAKSSAKAKAQGEAKVQAQAQAPVGGGSTVTGSGGGSGGSSSGGGGSARSGSSSRRGDAGGNHDEL